MQFNEAAISESVVNVFHRIEDKLYESGMLVTATGDPESEVTIAFKEVVVGAKEIHALVIFVDANVPSTLRHLDWKAIRHYVIEKYSTLQDELPEDVRQPLLDSLGPVVFLNGVSTI